MATTYLLDLGGSVIIIPGVNTKNNNVVNRKHTILLIFYYFFESFKNYKILSYILFL
jgi:hypothetical protein